jgi:hypothetical protein
MSDRLSKLLQSFDSHISIPWPQAVSPDERTIFVVYNKEELKLRARIGEFEASATQSGHPWLQLDRMAVNRAFRVCTLFLRYSSRC